MTAAYRIAALCVALCAALPSHAWPGEQLLMTNTIEVTPEVESSLFAFSANNEPVLVVRPDGTVLVRGVAVESMNTDEAREAWRAVTLWVAQQYQHTSINSYLSKQTDYLLQRVEECERRCGE